jgi:uncharacterized LabA/DUF88 family protein
MANRPSAHVYVDGFNLYWALRKTPNKWLDLGTLFALLLPHYDVTKIHYCTARIKARLDDPDGPDRQDAYLRALATVPGLEIHYGKFQASKVYMRLVDPPPLPERPTVLVHKMEEKGSDVNVGTLMLVDAYENTCDVAVLVSNDSDLAMPLKVVVERLGRPVTLVNPYDANPSNVLRKQLGDSPSIRRLRQSVLAASQFPNPVVGQSGNLIHKPSTW